MDLTLKDWLDISVAGGTALLALGTGALAWFTRASLVEAEKARKNWSSMAADATRSRLDAAAPAVDLVSIADDRALSFFRVGKDQLGDGPSSLRLPFVATSTAERDAEREFSDPNALIGMTWVLEIQNHSQSPVQIYLEGRIAGAEGKDFRLAPGSMTLNFEAVFSLAEWLENYHADQRGEEDVPHVAEASVSMSDCNQTGVDDSWHLKLTGIPFQDDGDGDPRLTQESAWTQIGYRERTYYLLRWPEEEILLADAAGEVSPPRQRLRRIREWISARWTGR